jgi:hypothetical protein
MRKYCCITGVCFSALSKKLGFSAGFNGDPVLFALELRHGSGRVAMGIEQRAIGKYGLRRSF